MPRLASSGPTCACSQSQAPAGFGAAFCNREPDAFFSAALAKLATSNRSRGIELIHLFMAPPGEDYNVKRIKGTEKGTDVRKSGTGGCDRSISAQQEQAGGWQALDRNRSARFLIHHQERAPITSRSRQFCTPAGRARSL